ncbi:hypothetical protein SAMN04487957_104223 [Halomonas shengliensis]|uniref:Uncharacterized protein n=1 Tax=Halomonas shengliensis TaxID=419597 RepID=A0A1H0HLM6_9GAMM|nr:hypothetical protein SAMN04487957_104223 [Halomonas shengliensis]
MSCPARAGGAGLELRLEHGDIGEQLVGGHAGNATPLAQPFGQQVQHPRCTASPALLELAAPCPRGECQAYRQRHHHPHQHGQQAVGPQRQDVLAVGDPQQGDHGGGVAREQRGVGDHAVQGVADAGAQADPERQADHQPGQAVAAGREQRQPHRGAHQGAQHAVEALLDEQLTHRLGGGPDGHRRPLGVLQADRPGDDQGQAGGQGGAQGKAQAFQVEAGGGEPTGEGHGRSSWRGGRDNKAQND